MTTLRPISFQLEITQRRWCSYTKTKKMIEFKTDRWHHKHMIQLSGKEFRQLVKKQVEASLGKKLRLWDHRVLNQAESSAREAMHNAYKDIKQCTVKYELPKNSKISKIQFAQKLGGGSVKWELAISDDEGLLRCTKDKLRQKLESGVKIHLRGSDTVSRQAFRKETKEDRSDAKILVTDKFVDFVYDRIRKKELASAQEKAKKGPKRQI